MHVESVDMNSLLKKTTQHNATDLHLCAGSKPLIRVNSKLQPIEGTKVLTPKDIDSMIEGYIDDAKKKKLESDKVLDFSYSVHGMGRFRCNIYKQRGTHAVAIRALPIEIPDFEQLGLPHVIKKFTEKTRGLVLVTGATSTGKSTTLASLIDMINKKYHYHIITIEDPLEYLHKHNKSMVTQREIGEDAHCFVSALRSALREDPDVIMLGEMRDIETVSIALSAAETGHLVFSTLHTMGAVKSIDRIIDSFPTGQQNQVRSQLASVLEGVVSQHLVPQINNKGLTAVAEVMIATPAVRNLIREGKHYQIDNLIQSGGQDGMRSLERSLADLFLKGLISKETAEMNANDVHLLHRYMSIAKK